MIFFICALSTARLRDCATGLYVPLHKHKHTAHNTHRIELHFTCYAVMRSIHNRNWSNGVFAYIQFACLFATKWRTHGKRETAKQQPLPTVNVCIHRIFTTKCTMCKYIFMQLCYRWCIWPTAIFSSSLCSHHFASSSSSSLWSRSVSSHALYLVNISNAIFIFVFYFDLVISFTVR